MAGRLVCLGLENESVRQKQQEHLPPHCKARAPLLSSLPSKQAEQAFGLVSLQVKTRNLLLHGCCQQRSGGGLLRHLVQPADMCFSPHNFCIARAVRLRPRLGRAAKGWEASNTSRTASPKASSYDDHDDKIGPSWRHNGPEAQFPSLRPINVPRDTHTRAHTNETMIQHVNVIVLWPSYVYQ